MACAAAASTRVRSAESSTSAAISAAVRHRSATPGIVAIAFSTWKVDNAATAAGRQVCARRVEDGGDALHATCGAGQPVRQRRELAAQQREQAAAEQVGIGDRRPRRLVELLLLEAQFVDDAEQHGPVDPFLAVQAVDRFEALARLVKPGQASLRAGIGHVRPSVVVLVVAGLGGVHRVEAEKVGEEGVLRLGKTHAAHGAITE